MGLSNARFRVNGRFFWDERAETLEEQVLGPIQDHIEMGMDLDDLVLILAQQPYYPILFKRAFGDEVVLIFVFPPSMAELERRLKGRGTDQASEVKRRLRTARAEHRQAAVYDYWLVNDDLGNAAASLAAIVVAERQRAPRTWKKLPAGIKRTVAMPHFPKNR